MTLITQSSILAIAKVSTSMSITLFGTKNLITINKCLFRSAHSTDERKGVGGFICGLI